VPRGKNIAIAALVGVGGALVGAAVWAGVALATDFEVGYIAVLVGYLTGHGVKRGAGKQRGLTLQYLAASIAAFGYLAAKFAMFAYMVVKLGHERGYNISYFNPRLLTTFPNALPQMLGVFDVLFVFLALAAAYRVPKAPAISISKLF
jgi:hypothetical protein